MTFTHPLYVFPPDHQDHALSWDDWRSGDPSQFSIGSYIYFGKSGNFPWIKIIANDKGQLRDYWEGLYEEQVPPEMKARLLLLS